MHPPPEEFIDLAIVKSVHVAATRHQVWQAWTNPAEVVKWFGRGATIDLRPGGAYEIYFLMDHPPGRRGGEGNVIQGLQPGRRLDFTWNAPPSFGALREKRTFVHLELNNRPTGGTDVSLTHFGWRAGDDWAEVHAYFEQAWNFVLRNLAQHFSPSVKN